jgi:hypothetical protein
LAQEVKKEQFGKNSYHKWKKMEVKVLKEEDERRRRGRMERDVQIGSKRL